MRNKTMRRGLAWILSAATIMTSVPVSAEEIVLETGVVSEDEAAAEEQSVDADLEEEVSADDADIESQVNDDEEEAVVIDGTDEQEQSEVPASEETVAEEETEEIKEAKATHTYADEEGKVTIEVKVTDAQEFPEGIVKVSTSGETDQELSDSDGTICRIVNYTITDADGNEIAFPEGTEYKVTDGTETEDAKVYFYKDGALSEVENVTEEEDGYSFETDDLSIDYIWTENMTENEEVVLEAESESEEVIETEQEIAEQSLEAGEDAASALSAGESVADVTADFSSVESLKQGVYAVNANIIVYPQDNQVLNNVTVYMTGPNFPPTAPQRKKVSTLTVDEKGDAYVNIVLDNVPASIFTLQELGSSDDVEVVEVKKDNEQYGNIYGRITEVTVKLKNLSGQYAFGDCKEYPTIFKAYKDMPLHLWVDLANAEEKEVAANEFTLTDSTSGAKMTLSSEDADALAAFKSRQLIFSAKKADEGNYEGVTAILNETYDELQTGEKYELYEISLKDAEGNAVEIPDNIKAVLTVTPTKAYGDLKNNYVRAWQYDGSQLLDITADDTKATETEITVTVKNTKLLVLVNEAKVNRWVEDTYSDKETGVSVTGHLLLRSMLDSSWKDQDYKMQAKMVRTDDGDKKYYVKIYKSETYSFGDFSMTIDKNPDAATDKDYVTVQLPELAENETAYLVENNSTVRKLNTITSNGKTSYLLINTGNYTTTTSELENLLSAYNYDDASGSYILVTEKKYASDIKTSSTTYTGKEITGVKLDDTLEVVGEDQTKGINAGTYTGQIKPAKGYTWKDGTSDVKTYTWRINKATIYGSATWYLPYNYASKEYTEALPTEEDLLNSLVYSGFVNGETEETAAEFEKAKTKFRGTLPDKTGNVEPGEYSLIEFTGGKALNYNIKATCQIVIGMSPEMDQGLTDPADAVVYNGRSQWPLKETESDLSKKNLQVRVLDSDGEYKAFNLLDNGVKDAGYYTDEVKLQFSVFGVTYKETNMWSDGTTEPKTLTKAFTISKAPLIATVEDKIIEVYDGTQIPTVTVSGFVANESADVAKDYVAPTASLPDDVEPGQTYTVTPEGGSAKNYEFTEHNPGKVTIEKVAVKKPMSVDNIPYSGNEVTGVFASGKGYTVEGDVSATNAGTYTATIKLNEGYVWDDETHSTDDMTVTWTITPATASMPQAVSGLVYNGTEQTGVTAATGVVLTGTTKAANAGTYTARAIPADDYVWEDGTADIKTITWSIAKKGVAAPSAANELVYNGAAQTGVAAGEGYTISGNAAATDAGSYTAVATLDGNHSWMDGSNGVLTLTWSIAKAEQTVNAATANKTYKLASLNKKSAAFSIGASAAGAVSYKITAAPKNGAKYITVNAGGKVTMKKKAPAGTYQVTVSAASTANQNAGSKVVTITVAKDKQKLTAKLSKKTVKVKAVKKKAARITIKAKAAGKLSYKVVGTPAGAGKYITVSKKGKVTLKKGAPKGTYQIRVTAKETSKLAKAEKTVNIVVK